PLLLGAQGLGQHGQLAPPDIHGEQRIEVGRGAATAQRGPVAARILPGSLEINHSGESSRAPAVRTGLYRDPVHFTHPAKPGLVTVAGKPSATLKLRPNRAS